LREGRDDHRLDSHGQEATQVRTPKFIEDQLSDYPVWLQRGPKLLFEPPKLFWILAQLTESLERVATEQAMTHCVKVARVFTLGFFLVSCALARRFLPDSGRGDYVD